MTDLIHSTFKFPNKIQNNGLIIVSEFENMRPDLVANRAYGDQSKWDALLKYNGISNPFSLSSGDLLYALSYTSISGVYANPRVINERGERLEILADGSLVGIYGSDKDKDKNRVDNLIKKRFTGSGSAKNTTEAGATIGPGGALPPNFSKAGDKSVKVKDGKIVFGEDVTTINKDNCPIPISRVRLHKALIKDRLFL